MVKSKYLYLFFIIILSTSCTHQNNVDTTNYEDYILVLLDKHHSIVTNTESFIEAKDFLARDTLNSDSIYLRLSEIRRGIQKNTNPNFQSLLYGVTPPDSEIYAFHTSPGDHLIFEAIKFVNNSQLRSDKISSKTLIQDWEQHLSEQTGSALIKNINLSIPKNVDYIVQQFINKESTSPSLKYLATYYVVEEQKEIDYKRYKEIIFSLDGALLTDFILLFKSDYDTKNLRKEFDAESRKTVIAKLEKRKLSKSTKNNQNAIDRTNQAITIVAQ